MKRMHEFSRFLYTVIVNSKSAVIILLLILLWFAVAGPMLHFNHQWFFILEAFAISITLLMTFVIEHTQKADTKALQEKLDELLRKHPKANKKKVGIEKHYKGEKK